ncbi:unnamed protein product, partial [Protopolystoma xenopodis]
MLPRSDDVRHMTEESLAPFHRNRRRLPRKQRQHESSGKANRQLLDLDHCDLIGLLFYSVGANFRNLKVDSVHGKRYAYKFDFTGLAQAMQPPAPPTSVTSINGVPNSMSTGGHTKSHIHSQNHHQAHQIGGGVGRNGVSNATGASASTCASFASSGSASTTGLTSCC